MKAPVIIFLTAVVLAVVGMSAYTVSEREQVIITQFGKPVGKPVVDAGLHFKIPFMHKANRMEKRILLWDGKATMMTTKDKLFITVDTFARWRIEDPLQFLKRLKTPRRAQSRLDDILGSETRNVVANNRLIEIIRSTRDRVPKVDEDVVESGHQQNWLPIRYGQARLEQEIMETAREKLKEFGVELLDIRFKRIDYNRQVKGEIYSRMISERNQIAERFRSEGAGEAAKIRGNKERELLTIESEAYRKIQEIRGQADAQATQIYADAYNQSPAAIAFYEFLKTMETYQQVIDSETTMVLSTDGELFQYLKGIDGGEAAGEIQAGE